MKTFIVGITIGLFAFGGLSGATRASEMEIGVDMTPMTQQVVEKSDPRFENYALENSAAAGQ
jgi:hypothetical protein